MKRFVALMIVLLVFLITVPVGLAEGKNKSSVLLVFNEQSGRNHDERLSQIAHEELAKKVNGLYVVIPSKKYEDNFSKRSHYEDSLDDVCNLVFDSNTDYFVYVELMPFNQAEGFNIIWHSKKMKAHMGLRIIDMKVRKEIFKEVYESEKEDDTDFFFVGSPSMARKSLRGVLFTVGEAISVHLPL